MNISLAVNIFLLAVKIYAFIASRSKAILASAADSLVDIASQLVIAYAEYKASFSTTPCSICSNFPHLQTSGNAEYLKRINLLCRFTRQIQDFR